MPDAPSIKPPSTPIGLSQLRPGCRLASHLFDAHGVLLLAAGTVVTPQFLDLLSLRDIVQVFVRPPAGSEKTAEHIARHMDDLLSTPSACSILTAQQAPPARQTLPLSAFRAEIAAGAERYHAAVTAFEDIAGDIQLGQAQDVSGARALIGQFLKSLLMDSDLLPTLCDLSAPANDYLFKHCVNVALLAVNTGAALGLNDAQLQELGVGVLLKDLGMLSVPPEIRFAQRELTPAEWAEIERHPLHTLEMLHRLRNVTPGMMYVGYQCHERGDGTGYPNRRRLPLVHTYARITSVADAYAAMTTDRPHRRGMTPYEAMRTLLTQGAADKFDRVILRAFLDTLSLFPIGSYVRLSSGHMAKVMRPNPGAHTKPIVALVDPEGRENDHTVNLARATDLRVVQAFGLRFPGKDHGEPAPMIIRP